jgi:hypothetical protein
MQSVSIGFLFFSFFYEEIRGIGNTKLTLKAIYIVYSIKFS